MAKQRHSAGRGRARPTPRSGRGTTRRGGARASRGRAPARRRPTRRSKGNRRVEGEAREGSRGKARSRAPRDPEEFKARNRTILLLLVLAFVNAWIFVWRDEGGLDSFDAKAAVIGRGGESGFAEPLVDACGGDPVDIFAGLDDRLRLDGRLSEGRTLRLALLELGIDGGIIDEVEAAIRDTMDLGLLEGSGAWLRLAGDRHGGLQALELEVSEGHLVQLCRSPAGFEVRNIQHPLRVDVTVIALELPKDGSLLAATEAAGQTPALARRIADALAGEVDVATETRPGDSIQVLVEKRYLGRHFHRYGKLLALRYIGHGGRIAYYRYKPRGQAEAFFDHEGQPMKRALLRTPFAWNPVDPEARGTLAPAIEYIDGRMGAVYKRPLGTPIVAVGDAVVRRVGRAGDDGLSLELELEDGRRVRYANLLRTVGDLVPGSRVHQGQLVALVGRTGKTPIPRLRLELLDRSRECLDPMLLLARGRDRAKRVGAAVPEAQLEQFTADIKGWRRAMRKAAG